MTQGRICKRCLLHESGDEAMRDMSEHIYKLIEAMPEHEKAGCTLRQERLAHCTACDCLQNGMCRLCGCYVEWRAAKAVQSCPHPHARW